MLSKETMPTSVEALEPVFFSLPLFTAIYQKYSYMSRNFQPAESDYGMQ